MQTDTVLAIPADAVARDALLRRLSALSGLDHPFVEPVGAAVARPDGNLVVPRGAGHATDLATILTVRGRCTVAEASGLAVDVGQGLAALHSEGIVHGALDLTDVVIGLDGRPCLRPRLDLPTSGAQEADDVHGLARLVETVVGPQDGDDLVALRAALAPALADDARVRPEAGTLAARVHDAVLPETFRVPEPSVLAAAALAGRSAVSSTAARTHRRARRATGADPRVPTRAERQAATVGTSRRRGGGARWRVGLGAVGVGAVVCLMAVIGLRLTAAPDTPATADVGVSSELRPTGSPSPTEEISSVLDRSDPAAAAADLTRRRVAVLADDRSVDDVALAGSPAHEAVADEQAQAEATGTQVLGAAVEVSDARLVSVSDADADSDHGEAEVTVEYTIGPHQQISPDGAVVEVPRGAVRADTLRLAWTDDGWRVTDVS